MTSYAHTVSDPTDTVAALQEQVAALKGCVHRVFGEPMADTLAQLEDQDAVAHRADASAPLTGRLTGAKLLVSAAYLYLDIIWMYLRTKGIDPESHPVHTELSYFDKISAISNERGLSLRVDKDAAARIVGHATEKGGRAQTGKHTRFREESTGDKGAKEGEADDVGEAREKRDDALRTTKDAGKGGAASPRPRTDRASRGAHSGTGTDGAAESPMRKKKKRGKT
ncbi:hypothetical protein MSPP1_000469 [Malassezia sp. CBS 17886]|nr:hypothetical protein MSPP1_000469 [Malassezia sp. CBS 17886]